MHPVLVDALDALGIAGKTPRLERAAKHSRRVIEESRNYLLNEVPANGLPIDVVVLGSFARGEASAQSDFDFLVVTHSLPDDIAGPRELVAAVERLEDRLDVQEPGPTGMFGWIVSAPDLTEKIGLEEDTNLSHSRRILLLEESVSIYQPDLRDRLVHAIIQRYLADYLKPKKGVPRFLLNDIIRYWRTLAVDYQAKRWSGRRSGWGLRYLKLIISRKLTFAGTLASVFLTDVATAEYFSEQFNMPPLARLAQLHNRLENEELKSHLRNCLVVAENFAEALAEDDFRQEVQGVGSKREASQSQRFLDMQDQARKLQRSLEALFFDSEALQVRSKRYLGF